MRRNDKIGAFFVPHVDLGFAVINGNRTGMKMVDGCILFL